ncbi:hypothetical protein IC229_34105 [Spirosoma sp. BT702]|uniref:SMP-30/Gluconolactonase/LRE-like region domain-containing protein n=1 Tax=Spirosoma profusum TaxID=2771354 RepID=A0A927AWH0_9BACT|nr:hypothetical protein [Spirosoma profusum]
MAVDRSGNLFIADVNNHRICKVSPAGVITTVAGGGLVAGGAADGGPATSAEVRPRDVAVDGSGNLFICDESDRRIRKVSPAGIITTVASTDSIG